MGEEAEPMLVGVALGTNMSTSYNYSSVGGDDQYSTVPPSLCIWLFAAIAGRRLNLLRRLSPLTIRSWVRDLDVVSQSNIHALCLLSPHLKRSIQV
jgi:hypothetical protein